VPVAGSRFSATGRRDAARPKRMGHEVPRVFTPPLRPLTPETSAGFSVIEFAESVLEVELFPWQKWLLVHALELLPDGSFRFRTVVVLVARQNGKSTLSQVLALWAMYVLGIALVIGTAQDLDVAEEIWQGAVELVEEVPDLADEIAHVDKTNGKKALRLKSGERYKVKAANRRAGRGLSGDLILLDELREHTSWDAWGAITKTTMARANAQVWALSNAGDAASVVARYLRRMAHEALGDPDGIVKAADPGRAAEVEPDDEDLEADGDTLGLFEWSAPPGCDRWDRDGWAAANPSLGYTITERTIAGACKTDPEWVFRTEVLCQWSDGSLEGPFPPGAWEAGVDAASSIPDDAAVSWCVDVSWDRATSYVAVAGLRDDGVPHVEVAAMRSGLEWVPEWFRDRADPAGDPMRVVVQTKGAPASSLVDDLRAIPGVEVVEWGGADLGIASGLLYDLVCRSIPTEREDGPPLPDGVRHLPQPVLDVAAGVAVTKPLGDSWVWNRKGSPQDIAPLVAVTGAVWHATRPVEVVAVSAYETRGLITI
jgi:hypothetical protein